MSQVAGHHAEHLEQRSSHMAARRGDSANAGALPPFSPFLYKWFNWYLKRYFAKNFHAIRVAKAGRVPAVEEHLPVVLYTNHPSWWDAVMFIYTIHTQFPGRPLYGPMEAHALEKYRFFKRLGIFGIEKDTARGAAQFLRTGRAILDQTNGVLGITAQGDFVDVRVRPIRLRPGLGHLLHKAPAAVVVPLAVEYTFWEERYPEILLRFGEAIRVDEQSKQRPDDWTAMLEAHLQDTMDALAADAMSRQPRRFDTVLDGSAGVGGVYDTMRRAGAWLRGRRFDPHHGEEGAAQ